MIRLSTPNDLNGIINVWHNSFGDNENDIRFFLDYHYKPDNTVVCELNGIIVSVLFLLEGDMHIKGSDYPSYYLYAACTLREYRGREIMASLLSYTKKISAERNKFYIVLKPAEESLYGFYSKFGYKAVFTKRISEITINHLKSNNFKADNNCVNLYSRLRDNVYSDIDYFKWNENAVSFAVKHHKYYGGDVVERRNGYALYSKIDGFIYVKEITFTQENAFDILRFIAEKANVGSLYIETPYNLKINCAKTKVINSGMLLPLCVDAQNKINDIENVYLALTLD